MEQQSKQGRAYGFTQWHADFAKAFAAGVPLECAPTKARGALLAADNDEDELVFSLDRKFLTRAEALAHFAQDPATIAWIGRARDGDTRDLTLWSCIGCCTRERMEVALQTRAMLSRKCEPRPDDRAESISEYSDWLRGDRVEGSL